MSSQDIGNALRNHRAPAAYTTPAGEIHVRGLTGRERSAYFAAFKEAGADQTIAEHKLVAMCWCNPDGTPVYANGSADAALDHVLDWDPEIVSALAALILKKSGLAPGADKDAEKN